MTSLASVSAVPIWQRARRALRQLLACRVGASFVEYLLVCGIVALGLIAGFKRLRTASDNTVGREGVVVSKLNNVNGSGGPLFPGLGGPGQLTPGLGNGGGLGPRPGGKLGLPVVQPSQCFAAGTPVLTAEGERPIEAIVPGELVWSRHELSGEPVLAMVARTFVTPRQLVIGVDVPWDVGKTERIRVTPDHPFWVEGAGWLPARELSSAPLGTATGLALGTASASEAEPVTVYNLEVEGHHTFYVGRAHALVHNTCKYAPQSYSKWKKDPTKPANTEVNHLNQNAVYGTSKGGAIPYGEGISVPLTGGTDDVNGQHYKYHRSLEDFWDQYRPGGAKFGDPPTNAEYGAAVEKALIDAGIPPVDALNLAQAARQQRIDAGYADDELVPRIPGPFMKRKPPSAPVDDENRD